MQRTNLYIIPIFYLSWILFSLGLNWAGHWIPFSVSGVASYLFMFTALLLLSGLTGLYRQQIEPQLQQSQLLRIGGLFAGLLLSAGIYILVAKLALRSDLISAFHTANLLFLACLLGHWLVIPLKRPAELVPLCLVMSLVDIYSVFKGPTKSLTNDLSNYYSSGQSGAPPFIDYILVKFPMPGQAGLQPVFGISDWILIAMLSAAAAKFGMSDNLFGRRSLPYLSVAVIGLIISIMLAREANLYLPALPLVALFFLSMMAFRHPEIRQLTRNELRPLGLIFILFAGLLLFL